MLEVADCALRSYVRTIIEVIMNAFFGCILSQDVSKGTMNPGIIHQDIANNAPDLKGFVHN